MALKSTLLIVLSLLFVGASYAQSVTVSTTVDENNGNTASIASLIGTPGGAGISLREAILATSNEPVGATITITLPTGTYTITIAGSGENNGATGDFDLNVPAAAGTKTVNLNGAGAATTIINGGALDRIFDVHPVSSIGSITFNLSNVTLTNGNSPNSAGAMLTGRAGDVTTVTNCIFNANTAVTLGGAISQSSSSASHNLTVTGSTFSNNTSGASGGAINYAGLGGTVTINGNTFTGNTATGSGGAIHITGTSPGPATTNITRNTFTGNTTNSATDGGAAVSFLNAAAVNINFNRIVGNTALNIGVGKMVSFNTAGTNTSNNSDNNWWGANTGPAAADISGTAASFWLQLRNTPATTPIVIGQATTFSADILGRNAGGATSSANLVGLPAFPTSPATIYSGAVGGTLTSNPAGQFVNGIATVSPTYTATAVGSGSVNAAVDGVTASGAITVNKAATTIGQTSSQNPSIVGQSVTFTATIAVTAPGVATPTGTVQFLDGGVGIAGCTAVALTGSTAQCPLSNLTAASHTITAVYAGDANTLTSNGSLTGNPQVVSNTAVWTGTSSTSWSTASNWSTNAIPSATNDVSLPSTGVTNQPAIPSGPLLVNSLTIASGRTLNLTGGNLTVNGVLTMNGGDITVTGANVLAIGGTGSIVRTAGSVIGNLSKTFTAVGAFTYPVGTAGNFSPFTANVTALTTNPSVLMVAAFGIKDPNNNAPADRINRYWDVNLTSGALTADLNYVYLAGDVPVSNNEAGYAAIKDNGTTVTRLPVNCGGSPPAGSACVTPATHTVTVKGISSFSKWSAGALLGPSAGNASITGRVLDPYARGVANIVVRITEQSGNIVYAVTNPFGYYRFAGVSTGQTVVIAPAGKRYAYQPRLVSLTDDLAGLDFSPQ